MTATGISMMHAGPNHAAFGPGIDHTARARPAGFWLFPKGWVSELLICRFANAGVVGGRLWLTGFPLCFGEKYGKLARTDLKNGRISLSGGFQACYEIIRGVVGGLSSALNFSISNSETHPLGKSQNPASNDPYYESRQRRRSVAAVSLCG